MKTFSQATRWAAVTIVLAGFLFGCVTQPTEAPPTEEAATEVPAPTREAPTEEVAEEPAPTKTGEVTEAGRQASVILGSGLSTMDPHAATDVDAGSVRFHIYDNLIAFKPGTFDLMPQLAESWEVGDDNRTYTFHLRQGIKFHDGTDFNAQAVKTTLERAIDPEGGWKSYSILNSIDTIEVVDDYTVEIITAEVFAPLLRNLATSVGAIISPAAIDEFGEDLAVNPVGTGPFKFVEWVKGDHLLLEKNEDYWGDPPDLDSILVKIVPEAATRVTLLETGEADVVFRLPPQDAPALEENPDIEVIALESNRSVMLFLNHILPPMDQVAMRQAVQFAIDREALVDSVLFGIGVSGDSVLGGTNWGYCPQPVAYDPEKAREFLAEADYDGSEIVMWSPRGRYVRDAEMAQAIEAMLEDVGINVNLEIWGDWPALLEAYNDMNYHIGFVGWAGYSGDPDWGLSRILDSSVAGKAFNYSGVNSSEIDRLLEEGRRTLDPDEREEIYCEIQRLAFEDGSHAYVTFQTQPTGVNTRLKGLVLMPTEHWLLRTASIEE